MDTTILPYVTALLAVVAGPMVSWIVSARQLKFAKYELSATVATANKQLLGPLRESWLRALRELLAELTSSAFLYSEVGLAYDLEKFRHLVLLQHQVQLMLNPMDTDHAELECRIRKMVSALSGGGQGKAPLDEAYNDVMNQSREVLEQEWKRVEQPIDSDFAKP